MMRKFLLGTVSAVALGGTAMAADLPSRQYAPPPPIIPIFTWTGFYVGVNAGYGWSTNSNSGGVFVPGVGFVDSGGVFVFIGADAETGWMPDAIVRDERGYVRTGEAVARSGQWRAPRDPYLLETSVPGIFACGDVRSGPVKRVAAAVGEGSMAIAFVHQFLSHDAQA